VLYFDEIPSERDLCFNVDTKKAFPVLELKPALVRVYSYYRRDEEEVSVQYELPPTQEPEEE